MRLLLEIVGEPGRIGAGARSAEHSARVGFAVYRLRVAQLQDMLLEPPQRFDGIGMDIVPFRGGQRRMAEQAGDDANLLRQVAGMAPLLYDLTADPGERANRAASPAHRELLLHATQRMLIWRLAHAERGFTHMVTSPAGLVAR